jgi:hypothetical protein
MAETFNATACEMQPRAEKNRNFPRRREGPEGSEGKKLFNLRVLRAFAGHSN